VTKEQDWGRFCKLLELAAEVTAGSKRSDAAAALMFEMLKQYTFEQVNDAVMAHIRANRFFPAPSDIITFIDGNIDDRARLAFEFIKRVMGKVGPYETVQLPDPKMHYALIAAVGGWEQLAETPEDELQFVEKRFIDHYRNADRMGMDWTSPGVPQVLNGIIWRENSAKGHALPPAHRFTSDGNCLPVPAEEIKALTSPQVRQLLEKWEGGNV
jgi:hypothetical protein